MQPVLRLFSGVCVLGLIAVAGTMAVVQLGAVARSPVASAETDGSAMFETDDQWLVFEVEAGLSWDIFLARTPAGALRQLTHHFASDRFPALSPDHRRVAFVSWRDGNSEIYVVQVDSNEAHNISNDPANDLLPVWSPDGSMLAFVSNRDGNSEIYLADVVHSLFRNLTSHPAHDTSPQWTPDPLALRFRSDRAGDMKDYVIDVGGQVFIPLEA